MPSHLSRHSIVIRKRTLVELADLALRLSRNEFPTLFALFVPFAATALLINWFLLGNIENWSISYELSQFSVVLSYLSLSLVLMWFEMAFVSSLMTAYLGLYAFSGGERVQKREALAIWFERFPQVFVYLILLRPLYMFHPFLSAVILLERTPYRAKSKETLTTKRRSVLLHRDQFGETVAFGICVLVVTSFLSLGIFILAYYCLEMFVGTSDEFLNLYFYLLIPGIIWCIMLPVCLMQFLRYLDLRIEREGWDVELAFRIERMKMLDTGPGKGSVKCEG